MNMEKIRVLFLCTGNSARSQMAEGLLRQLGGDRLEVHSAGTHPRSRVHPHAVRTMADHGIDISAHRPKDLEAFVDQRFDYVITVCDRAKESCPVLAGAEMIHWSFRDPADAPEDKQALAFREAFAGLRRRIELFVTVTAQAQGAAERPVSLASPLTPPSDAGRASSDAPPR